MRFRYGLPWHLARAYCACEMSMTNTERCRVMNHASETIIHATAVALDGGVDEAMGPCGLLLRGPSGSGKSDLALRLIDAGATLVADDRTVLLRQADRVLLSPPEAIRGRLEVRGLGIVPVDHVTGVRLTLICDLVGAGTVERLPEPRSETVLGVSIPLLTLDPFEFSAPAKVHLAVRAAACGILHQLD